jgi:hypothetical protein
VTSNGECGRNSSGARRTRAGQIDFQFPPKSNIPLCKNKINALAEFLDHPGGDDLLKDLA